MSTPKSKGIQRPNEIEIPVPAAFKQSALGKEVERVLQKDYKSLKDDQLQGVKTTIGWKVLNYNNANNLKVKIKLKLIYINF